MTSVKCLLVGLFATLTLARPAAAAPLADWVYLDLGEVVLSGNPTDGYTYVPGAMAFLHDLRAQGFKIAALTNIPESWGETCGQKVQALQSFVAENLKESQGLDWTLFDAVIVPPYDRYRKPHQFMFLTALGNACSGRALYIGEDATEVAAARALGLAGYHKASPSIPLPTPADVSTRLQTEFKFVEPDSCDFNPLIGPVLDPQDRATGITGCVVVPQ